ncbi:MAG: HEPN domain-containing protein [Sedimentisphaerales bacterium]|nr:HEPN domain-containing protein [Sedimentisphaerales bacterium]
MKNRTDLVQGWLRKAASNFAAMEAARQAQVYDAACFHAQQAVELYLKAYLLFRETSFPLTHNLTKLVDICIELDSSFTSILSIVEPLTPYAVELRYDHEFWPDVKTAEQAKAAALEVKMFIRDRLPSQVWAGK